MPSCARLQDAGAEDADVWWRCHRRLVSDVAVLVHDVPDLHVMPDGRKSPHQPSEGAVLAGGGLIYPAPPDEPES